MTTRVKTREEHVRQHMTEGNAYRPTAKISVKTATLIGLICKPHISGMLAENKPLNHDIK